MLFPQVCPMLLDSAFADLAATATSFVYVGLSSVLASAASDIIRLSEHEPYGIRGASLILKLRY